MKLETQKEFRMRFFLLEKKFRTQMTNFYNAMTVHKNAEGIANVDITKVGVAQSGGSTFVQNRMREFLEWLGSLHEVSYVEAFTSQMVNPVKIASNYILSIREKTTKLNVWVLAKSIPYDDPFSENERRVTVSILVPDLQTVMSIRCKQNEANQLEHAMYEFDQVKPFPLVNRLHHFWKNQPAIKKIDSDLAMSEYDFLKTSFDDLNLFSCSIEMERYCEIASSQSNKRHLLGATSIVSCRINNVSFPWITIENILDPSRQIQIYVSESLEKNIRPYTIERFQDKFARIICVTWYDTGLEALNHPNMIEALFIREADDVGELVIDELIGFLRIRKKVSVELLESKFPAIEIQKIPQLRVEGQQVFLHEKPKNKNDVISDFLNCVNRIKKTRSEFTPKNDIMVTPEDILDPQRGSVRYLSRKENYVAILMKMIKSMDFDGFHEMVLPIADRKERRKVVTGLINFGLISQRDDGFSITPKGFDVACLSQKDNAGQIISNARKKEIISMAELEGVDIPPSILLKTLSETQDIVQSTAFGTQCNLFWYSSSLSDNAKNRVVVEKEIEKLMGSAFDALNKPYEVNESVVSSSIKNQNPQKPLSDMLVKTVLQMLKNCGKVKYDGTYFEYPLYERIARIFEKSPTKFFSVEHIMSQVIIPYPKRGSYGMTDEVKKELIIVELNNLSAHKKIVKVNSNLWTLEADRQSILSRYEVFVKNAMRDIVGTCVNRRSMMDRETLIGTLNSYKEKYCGETHPIKIDWDSIRDKSLQEMISNKEIVFDYYGLCKKGAMFQQGVAKQEIA